ncbi:GGDEF domain-containing protein [Massilia solisilvae]|uniref:diguanylate cyclase n=1 Tax=Massilia solisilvae TaxID=1811225 RepID=A0ABT2BKI1_9BURK|nr:GGDEF domain-containing protein [Massilia solisilvae]MCS0609026.1 GGDEF domain-containing protein [Massilia solisilvae]
MPTKLAALSSTPVSAPAPHSRLADLLLTSDPRQRRCLTVLLLASLVTAIGIALCIAGAVLDVFPGRDVAVVAVLAAATMATFFVIIRSGVNQRFADPTLAYPQIIAAQSLVAAGYAALGPVHTATLPLLVLVMTFGMFTMRAAAVRAACIYTLVAIGAVMLWRSRTDPAHYPPLLECFNFVMTATVLAAIAQLSNHLVSLRARLKSQRLALEDALAQIRELATHDELTGLPNRRHMLDLLNEHAQRRTRGGQRFYVGLIDLDHFKAINDSYGHCVGDEALRGFAQQAQAVLRTTDAIGRWGGEEFLLILPENGPGEPTVGIERLRAALADTAVSSSVPQLRLRFSAGLTRVRDGEPIGQVIERADHALYTAKSAGRGRAVLL